jgi:hypothetical protein
LESGIWDSIAVIEKNSEDINKIRTASVNILGLRIAMTKFSPDKGKVNDQMAYGI